MTGSRRRNHERTCDNSLSPKSYHTQDTGCCSWSGCRSYYCTCSTRHGTMSKPRRIPSLRTIGSSCRFMMFLIVITDTNVGIWRRNGTLRRRITRIPRECSIRNGVGRGCGTSVVSLDANICWLVELSDCSWMLR